MNKNFLKIILIMHKLNKSNLLIKKINLNKQNYKIFLKLNKAKLLIMTKNFNQNFLKDK